MPYVIAVDAGGTSTRCSVATLDGRCLGYGASGAGNPVSVGADAALAAFAQAISAALLEATLAEPSLAGAGLAGVDLARAGEVAGFSLAGHEAVQVVVSMAGGISTGQWPAFRAMLAGLGINQEPAMKSDLLGNFCSGTPELSGYVLDAGTGSGAVRIEDGVSSRTADGLGWLLGDAGSGFWIGSQAVRAAFADVDGRGPATRLTDLVFARLGLDFVRAGTGQNQTEGRPAVTLEGLRLIYELAPIELSRFASAAFEAAGDQVADAIVDRAIGQLAGTMRAVLRPEITGPVVLAGGVLTANRGFRDRLIERLRPDLPQATFLPVADGMVGALMLALRQAGLEAGPERFDRLSRTLAALPSRGTQLRVTPPLAPQP